MKLPFTPNANSRYDIVITFDATNTNPNGEPDGNRPRTMEVGNQLFGFTTNSSIKRKVRDTLEAMGHSILVTPIGDENEQDKINALVDEDGDTRRDTILKQYLDSRLFGGVFAGISDARPVTGPVQISNPMTVHAVEEPISVGTSRSMAIKGVTKKKKNKDGTETESESETGKLGSHWILPYGFFSCFGSYTPSQGKKTGVTAEDLEALFSALPYFCQETNSATRCMVVRGVYIFEHTDGGVLGCAPQSVLHEIIKVTPQREVPTSFKDIEVTISENLPAGVTLYRLLG